MEITLLIISAIVLVLVTFFLTRRHYLKRVLELEDTLGLIKASNVELKKTTDKLQKDVNELTNENRAYEITLKNWENRKVVLKDGLPKEDTPQAKAMKLAHELEPYFYVEGNKLCIDVLKGFEEDWYPSPKQKSKKK